MQGEKFGRSRSWIDVAGFIPPLTLRPKDCGRKSQETLYCGVVVVIPQQSS